jgi:hypothetical protein
MEFLPTIVNFQQEREVGHKLYTDTYFLTLPLFFLVCHFIPVLPFVNSPLFSNFLPSSLSCLPVP